MKHKTLRYSLFALLVSVLISGCNSEDMKNGGVAVDDTSITRAAPLLHSDVQNTQIKIYWKFDSDITSYKLEWGESQNDLSHVEDLNADKSSFTHKGLVPNHIYYYRLSALYGEDEPQESSKVLAVKTGSSVKILQSDLAG